MANSRMAVTDTQRTLLTQAREIEKLRKRRGDLRQKVDAQKAVLDAKVKDLDGQLDAAERALVESVVVGRNADADSAAPRLAFDTETQEHDEPVKETVNA